MATNTKNTGVPKSKAHGARGRGAARATAAGKKAEKVKLDAKVGFDGLIKPDSRMATGRGWRLSPDGGKTTVAATLLTTQDLGDRTIALFKIRSP